MNVRRLASTCVVAIVVAAVSSASPSPAASRLGPVIVEPNDGYAPIYALLRSPKKTLDLTIYKLRDAAAEQALIDDAQRGVRVRVLLDKVSGGPFNQPVFDELKAHGVDVSWASTHVSITHQKSFVIDRRKAVIMTGNLQAVYYQTSRDYALVDTKTKDVAAIEATFELDWANRGGETPAGADLVWSPGSESRLVALIGSAKHTLRVENEELKEPAIVAALAAAAKRGVAVQLLMMNQSNWRANFDVLKTAGVAVRTFRADRADLHPREGDRRRRAPRLPRQRELLGPLAAAEPRARARHRREDGRRRRSDDVRPRFRGREAVVSESARTVSRTTAAERCDRRSDARTEGAPIAALSARPSPRPRRRARA